LLKNYLNILLWWCCRRRKSDSCVCRCGASTTSSTKAESVCYAGPTDPATSSLELKLPGEVYDNPHYSHILIGGQPFFILPSGELSGHVPVPSQGERLSPLHTSSNSSSQPVDSHHRLHQQQQQHIYVGQGSSTYRSGGAEGLFAILGNFFSAHPNLLRQSFRPD
jgi:hypothetical protein